MVYCQLLGGKTHDIINLSPCFSIGEYVEIADRGHQYNAYTTAFKYFWGNEECYYLTKNNYGEIWKIINIALHPNGVDVLYHIRNRKGDNAVVSYGSIKRSKFHKRNRRIMRDILIYQLPFNNGFVQTHNWTNKLWNFYKDGEIIKNEKYDGLY